MCFMCKMYTCMLHMCGFVCVCVCLRGWWSTSPVQLIVWFVFVSVVQPMFMFFQPLFEVLD